jgi:hypothetical protein
MMFVQVVDDDLVYLQITHTVRVDTLLVSVLVLPNEATNKLSESVFS